MEPTLMIALVIGLAIGAGLAALLLRGVGAREFERGRTETQAQVAGLTATLAERDRQIEAQRAEIALLAARAEQRAAELQDVLVEKAKVEEGLAKERQSWGEKLALLNEAQVKLADAFRSLSADALRSNNQQFLDLAKTHLEKFQESARVDLDTRQKSIGDLVTPVQQSLEKVDSRIQELEKARVGAYESLQQQVKGLLDTQLQLRNETGNLVKALRQPVVRGRWGEIQLRRVAELAGMVNYCDFYEQQSASTEDGLLRPDMLVRLPGGKTIVVDAKAPLEAYLTSLEAPDDATRLARLVDHARQVRNHIGKLSQKRYWEQFKPTPEFVVLFLPGETFFAAALEQDPQLIEVGVESQVIVATPTTLIALLRAVSYGWRQEHIAENAQAISKLGRDLYERIAKLAEHWMKLGKSLDSAVDNYNKATGSLETRVLVAARRFRELDQGISAESIDDVSPVEAITREVQSEELLKLPGSLEQPAEGSGEAEKH